MITTSLSPRTSWAAAKMLDGVATSSLRPSPISAGHRILRAKFALSKYRLVSRTLAGSFPLVRSYHAGQPGARPTSGASMSHPAGTSAITAVTSSG